MVDDTVLSARFRALAPEPLPEDWGDVLRRTRMRPARLREPHAPRRRLLVGLAAAALVVVLGTATALGVRALLSGGELTAWGGAPAWSPDGRSIAFVIHRHPNLESELNVMNADASGRRVLARVRWTHARAWSPDGRTIAFVGPGPGRSDVFVVNTDGSGQRRVARGVRVTRDVHLDPSPAWSPDGRRIAFVSDRDGNDAPDARDTRASAEIYVMSADGSGQRRLTRNRTQDDDPVWSPDGRQIAFVRRIRDGNRAPRRQEIHVMNADGSGARMLARGTAPAWSPDGRKIAFRSDRDGNGEIYVMNADGSEQRRLTRSPDSDGRPVWSPDGRKLLFERAEWRQGNTEIFVVNPDGTGERNLTRAPGRDGSPAWSPDGRKIVFVSKRDRLAEIYVMNADGGGQRNLTRLGGGR